ncbi:altered inheritance of mitochondria protein 9, mitochondrial [Myxozyma melibiosi]|uniref:Altered inheritance of mitochondria protein 9, mitochondrial n=1 Tax=Myxozyma melibiosi TaxID=54550 RepID=A0ABR1F099_9ASCO
MLRLARYSRRTWLRQLQANRSFATTRSQAKQATKNDDSFVEINSASEKEREDFFSYTWGSWLKNDKQEKEKRYTPFSVEGINDVVRQFRNEKDTVAPAQVKSVASLSEGKHHRIYLVQMDDQSQYILRIPYPLDLSWEARRARMQSEVATMDFMRKKWDMRIPKVVSWSPTADNPIRREYMMMEYVSATNLMSKWHPIQGSIADRAPALGVVVNLLEGILATRFNGFGSLYFTENVDAKLQDKLPYEGEEDKELVDRWRLGPSVESSFWQNGIDHEGSTDRGPWYDPHDYLVAVAKAHITAYRVLLSDPMVATSELGLFLPTWLDTYEKYAYVAPRLIPDVPADSDLLSPRLYHPDMDPTNILVKIAEAKGDATTPFTIPGTNKAYTDPYLLDWEGASIKPYFLHGAPKFINYTGYKIYKPEEVDQYDLLPDQQKQQIDYMIAATANQYSFEFLIKHHFPTLINAFSPHAKTLREPYKIATASDYKYHPLEIVDLRDSLIKLQQSKPVELKDLDQKGVFTEDDIEKHQIIAGEWDKTVHQTPFYSTKGWLPQDMFEDLVKSKELVKDANGNYVRPSADGADSKSTSE